MKVVVGLREGPNKTNMRSEALIQGLKRANQGVKRQGREQSVKEADLYVQTGFAPSTGLKSAIELQIPYIIMEAPVFRDFGLDDYSSWGYNGLMGGAWRPQAPETAREKPTLQERHGGPQLIIGQKPTDHSLRGSDHVEWIRAKREALPEADFRPHPLMVPPGTLEPIHEVLKDYGEVYTYSSTVGVDALIAGCEVHAESDGSLLRAYTGSREEFIHELSWWQAHHTSYGALIDYILSGYDEARERAKQGLMEHPREKIDGAAACRRYYQLGL